MPVICHGTRIRGYSHGDVVPEAEAERMLRMYPRYFSDKPDMPTEVPTVTKVSEVTEVPQESAVPEPEDTAAAPVEPEAGKE